jgi:YVTN family beta-propeller protein
MAINPLQTRGYVSSEDSPKIHVVSLENLPPPKKLNTFNATHSVSHLATARQNVLLLVTAGMDGGHGVVSTITMNGNQIDRMDLGQDTEPIAITLCDNGKTLLVAVVNPSEVRKLAVANDGSLSDTGTRYSLKHGTDPADVLCASGSKTGVLVGDGRIYVNGTTIQAYLDSFDLSAMSRNQTMQLKYRDAISAVFSPNGKKLYVRSEPEGFSQNSTIEVFSYNPKRGNFTYFDQVSVPTTEEKDSSTLAIDENGSHLFVTDRVNDEVLVLNAGTLRKIQTLSGNLDGPFSIAIGGGAP